MAVSIGAGPVFAFFGARPGRTLPRPTFQARASQPQTVLIIPRPPFRAVDPSGFHPPRILPVAWPIGPHPDVRKTVAEVAIVVGVVAELIENSIQRDVGDFGHIVRLLMMALDRLGGVPVALGRITQYGLGVMQCEAVAGFS